MEYLDSEGKTINSLKVRVNDHGPWEKVDNQWVDHSTRIIDLSKAAFQSLVGTLAPGVVSVRVIIP